MAPGTCPADRPNRTPRFDSAGTLVDASRQVPRTWVQSHRLHLTAGYPRGCAAGGARSWPLRLRPASQPCRRLSADHHDANLPWPSLLPTLPTPNVPQPHAIPNCRRARIACIDRLIARLRRQYRRLDAACDHRVLFARSYLRITEGLREDLGRKRPRFFRHRRWMIHVIGEFSNSYFRAYRNYQRATGPVPEPWRITFDEAARGDAHAGQDVLLASNAHTQHDLPLAYGAMGLNTPGRRIAQARSRRRQRDQHPRLRRARGRVRRPLRPELHADRPQAEPARRDRHPGAGQVMARGRLAQRRAARGGANARGAAPSRGHGADHLDALGGVHPRLQDARLARDARRALHGHPIAGRPPADGRGLVPSLDGIQHSGRAPRQGVQEGSARGRRDRSRSRER